MPIKEAVTKYINDGDMLVSSNFLHSIPYATICEIIRQKIKDLIIVVCSAIEEVDLLLSGKCVSKIITSYYHRAGGRRYKRELDRALFDKEIEYEDYSNFTVMSMLTAGAMGYNFLPVMKSVKNSDIFNKRTFCGEDKLKTIKSPFSGEEIVVVPALNPDVAIVHVQRADKFGNAQFWGSEGTVKWSALSAKKVIVTCEEIVDHEKIKRSPFLTIIPSFRTTAVCEVPMGAHPSPVAGYYNTDIVFRSMFFTKNFSSVGNEEFMEEWVYKPKSRQEYITHYIEKYGREPLDYLKIKDFMSDQVNMGYKQRYWQEDFIHNLALTRQEYEKLTEEEGELEL